METYDDVVHIYHEADWSSTVVISWSDRGRYSLRQVTLPARLLWEGSQADTDWNMPPHIAVRVVRLATRGRVKWECDQVLSRPIPNRDLALGRSDKDGTNSWLFSEALATRQEVPLGWVENVAIAMWLNGSRVEESTSVMIDIGAPSRDPCRCGRKLLHDRGCPQAEIFPMIGRLTIDLERVNQFIETIQTARTSAIRTFVPEAG